MVSPLDNSIPKGTSLQYIAIGTYSDSSTEDITCSVSWISSDISNASITAEGLARGLTSGTTVTIIATKGDINGSTNLTITAKELISINITPADSSLNEGFTLQYTAIGIYTDLSTVDLTNSVTWSSSNPGVATISNAEGTVGLVTGVIGGLTTIEASVGFIIGNTSLTVISTPVLFSSWTF